MMWEPCYLDRIVSNIDLSSMQTGLLPKSVTAL